MRQGSPKGGYPGTRVFRYPSGGTQFQNNNGKGVQLKIRKKRPTINTNPPKILDPVKAYAALLTPLSATVLARYPGTRVPVPVCKIWSFLEKLSVLEGIKIGLRRIQWKYLRYPGTRGSTI
eukprot:96990-Rhodomonas_salina.4